MRTEISFPVGRPASHWPSSSHKEESQSTERSLESVSGVLKRATPAAERVLQIHTNSLKSYGLGVIVSDRRALFMWAMVPVDSCCI